MDSSAEQKLFRLVYKGQTDPSPRITQRIKGAFVADLELPIADIQKIMSSPPATVLSSESESEIGKALEILQAAGADVVIEGPAGSQASSVAGTELDEGVVFEIELEPASHEAPMEDRPEGKVFSLDLDSTPSAEEALSGLVEPGETAPPATEPPPAAEARTQDAEPAKPLPEMNEPLFSLTEESKEVAAEKSPADEESLFSQKTLEQKPPVTEEAPLSFSLDDASTEKKEIESPPGGEVPVKEEPAALDFDLQIAPEPVEDKKPSPKAVSSKPVDSGKEQAQSEHSAQGEDQLNLSVREEDDLILKPEPVIEARRAPETEKKPREAKAIAVPPLSTLRTAEHPAEPADETPPEPDGEETATSLAEEFEEFPAPKHRAAKKPSKYPIDTVAIILVMGLVLGVANWYYFKNDIPAKPSDSIDVDSSVQEVEKRLSELEAGKELKAALEGQKVLVVRNSSDDRSIEAKITEHEGKYKFLSLFIQRPAQAPLTNEEIVSGTIRPPWVSRIETARLAVSRSDDKYSATGPVMAYIEYNKLKSRASGLAEITFSPVPGSANFEFQFKLGNITEPQPDFSWAARKNDGTNIFFYQDKFSAQPTE